MQERGDGAEDRGGGRRQGKLADGAVTGAKLAKGAVGAANVASGAGIATPLSPRASAPATGVSPGGAEVTPGSRGPPRPHASVTIGGAGSCSAPKVEVQMCDPAPVQAAFHISL